MDLHFSIPFPWDLDQKLPYPSLTIPSTSLAIRSRKSGSFRANGYWLVTFSMSDNRSKKAVDTSFRVDRSVFRASRDDCWGVVSRASRAAHSDRYWLNCQLTAVRLVKAVAHLFASRNALFSMSSAPGPMISEFRLDVVFRICDTACKYSAKSGAFCHSRLLRRKVGPIGFRIGLARCSRCDNNVPSTSATSSVHDLSDKYRVTHRHRG